MHVPVKTYVDTWERLAASEEWGWLPGEGPYIGVQGDPDTDDAKVVHVYPDTPAAKAGIMPGDIITRFDDKPVDSFPKLAELVRNKKPGDRVKIQVLRDDKSITLDIVIGLRGSDE
jgi:S1-C subfamily serine protease